jgi:hypothetical protein
MFDKCKVFIYDYIVLQTNTGSETFHASPKGAVKYLDTSTVASKFNNCQCVTHRWANNTVSVNAEMYKILII